MQPEATRQQLTGLQRMQFNNCYTWEKQDAVNLVFLQSHGLVLNPEALIDFSPWRNLHWDMNFSCWESVSTAAVLPWDKSSSIIQDSC